MSDPRQIAIAELEAIRSSCHDEAVAEHNAEDARTAFAVVRDRCAARIDKLKQQQRDDVYRDWESDRLLDV